MAATLPQGKRGTLSSDAVAREARCKEGRCKEASGKDAAHRCRELTRQEIGAGRSGTMEGEIPPKQPNCSPSTTCSPIPCGAGHRRGHASESICVMFQKPFGRRRKLPTLTTIRRGNSASDGSKRNERADLEASRENFSEFLRRNYFELGIRAIAGLFVRPPPAEVRHMPEAASLHVLISDFHNQFGPQGFPG